jgi:hypothetical protein
MVAIGIVINLSVWLSAVQTFCNLRKHFSKLIDPEPKPCWDLQGCWLGIPEKPKIKYLQTKPQKTAFAFLNKADH